MDEYRPVIRDKRSGFSQTMAFSSLLREKESDRMLPHRS